MSRPQRKLSAVDGAPMTDADAAKFAAKVLADPTPAPVRIEIPALNQAAILNLIAQRNNISLQLEIAAGDAADACGYRKSEVELRQEPTPDGGTVLFLVKRS